MYCIRFFKKSKEYIIQFKFVDRMFPARLIKVIYYYGLVGESYVSDFLQ